MHLLDMSIKDAFIFSSGVHPAEIRHPSGNLVPVDKKTKKKKIPKMNKTPKRKKTQK